MSDDGDSNPYPPGSIAWWIWVHRHAVEVSDIWTEIATQAQIVLTSEVILARLAREGVSDRERTASFPPQLQGWLDAVRHAEAFLEAVAQALAQAGHPEG
jgi:hypothetical protein